MKRWLIAIIAAIVVVAGLLVWRMRPRPQPAGPVIAVAPGAGSVDVVVCYPPKAGLDPVEEVRHLPKPASPQDRLVQVVAELHVPPSAPNALPAFPAGSSPRAVFLSSDGVAYIDEPAATLDRMAGPRDEIVFVRAVLRAIARNCPEVKAVVFLADGASRPRLSLHLPAHGRYLIPKLVPAKTP